MLNRGDAGLLRSLDKLSATAASAPTPHGSSIAAHVEHLRYGLSLMNRWAAGENPFDDADWRASWRKTRVYAAQWKQLRDALAEEAHRWLESLKQPSRDRPVRAQQRRREHRAPRLSRRRHSPDRSVGARSLRRGLATANRLLEPHASDSIPPRSRPAHQRGRTPPILDGRLLPGAGRHRR